MSLTVEESSPRDSNMVKAPVTRKARPYQTAVERWSALKQNSDRSFDRLNSRNKLEEDRLLRKRRVIAEVSDAQLKDIFRVKNEMRVALIDIARSKRQYHNSESDFESRLRSGKQSPIFQMEYRRLRRKQVELEKLGEQLKGPNAKLLASNLSSELKSVDLKAKKELTRGESKYKGKWLAPLKNIQKTAMQNTLTEGESPNAAQSTKSSGNDFANLVKMVHNQFKEASLSENKQTESQPDNDAVSKDDGNLGNSFKLRLPSIAISSQLNSSSGRECSQNDLKEGGLYPVSKLHKPLSPINTECSNVEGDSQQYAGDPDVNVTCKRKKRQHKCSHDHSLPTLPEVSETPRVSPRVDAEADNQLSKAASKAKRSKKQKARTLLKKNIHRPIIAESAPISRTESARQRDRFVRKRLSDLASKTKEDITNRRSISPNDEALNSIHQAEVVTRLQLARSKVGITLPEVRRDKKAGKSPQDSRTAKGSSHGTVSLPPLNLEGKLLRELKAQRRKHHSTGLPKLP